MMRHGMLLGVDNSNHVRALRVVPTSDKASVLAAAAMASARVAVGAVTMGTATVAAPPPLSLQEVPYAAYHGGLPSWQAMPASGATLNATTGAAAAAAARAAVASMSVGAVGGVHCSVAPCSGSVAFMCGAPSGEVFVLDPHPNPVAARPAGGGSGRSTLPAAPTVGAGGLLVAGAVAAAGAGVEAGQVIEKLVGHVHPVTHLAVSRDDDLFLSADDAGSLLLWEKVDVATAERSGGAPGLVSDATIGRLGGINMLSLGAASTMTSKMKERLLEQINQSSMGRAGLTAARAAAVADATSAPPGGPARPRPAVASAPSGRSALPAGWGRRPDA